MQGEAVFARSLVNVFLAVSQGLGGFWGNVGDWTFVRLRSELDGFVVLQCASNDTRPPRPGCLGVLVQMLQGKVHTSRDPFLLIERLVLTSLELIDCCLYRYYLYLPGKTVFEVSRSWHCEEGSRKMQKSRI